MPIYEYQCKKCEKVVEKIHGMNDKPVVKCPACGGKADRKMSSGAFVFKGSGFYATDYGNKSKAPDSCPKSGDGAPACAGCPASAAK